MLTWRFFLLKTLPLSSLKSLNTKRTCCNVSGDHTNTTVFNLSPFQPVPFQAVVSFLSSGTSLLKYSSSVEANETCIPFDCFDQAPGFNVVSNVYSPW